MGSLSEGVYTVVSIFEVDNVEIKVKSE